MMIGRGIFQGNASARIRAEVIDGVIEEIVVWRTFHKITLWSIGEIASVLQEGSDAFECAARVNFLILIGFVLPMQMVRLSQEAKGAKLNGTKIDTLK